ncbi:acyl-[acyl-carrier-protein] thioesterase [Urechidicola croceus]|uniref:Acyl-ACP thioesterase n=1 Tax=Urechidicola croceus TaxID=1850246 RepID=A0A1D8PAJ2_9FLAO|nr:acyl-ACP thioesterase domain-containing protein [Urechidicola croceus]AOW21604.1 acyl-ACP thioesterase [Urechidicola croceus]
MENYFEKEFELRYFEMNKYGEASPTTILTLLEETAADHCYSIDYSLYNLIEQKVGWVLISGAMEMERYPTYKEKIIIRTWLSKYSTIKGFRENIIYDENYNVIGRSRGLWVFFDIERRRPIQIFDDIKKKWSYCVEESLNQDITKKIPEVNNADYTLEYNVNRYDTDMNKHVNNIRYLQWLMETIPDEILDNYYLHSIDGRFISEANYGDTIISLTENNIDDNSFSHTVKVDQKSTVCATATTQWRKKYINQV